MKIKSELRRAIMASLGVAALLGVSSQAVAITQLTLDGSADTGTLLKYGWSGSNNGNQGWAHNSDWYSLQASSAGTIEVQVKGLVTGAQPAFTVWSSGANEAVSAPSSHSYNQIGNTYWLTASFVGFANNTSDSNARAFGSGPSNTGLGGLAAAAGTYEQTGVDALGLHYADLFFNNLVPGNWYVMAVGGSGGSGGYAINAQSVAAVPVPGAAWLFASATAGLGLLKRKR